MLNKLNGMFTQQSQMFIDTYRIVNGLKDKHEKIKIKDCRFPQILKILSSTDNNTT